MALAGPAGLLAALCAAPASSIADSSLPLGREPDRPRPTGRAIVLLDRRGERIRPVLDRSGLRPEVAIPQVGVAAVEPADDRGWLPSGASFAGTPPSQASNPSTSAQRLIPDDPAYSAPDPQAHGDTYQWHLRDERFPRAWNRSTGAGARLAVIDTGSTAATPTSAAGSSPPWTRTAGSTAGRRRSTRRPRHARRGLACATGDNGYGGASSRFGCELIVEKDGSQRRLNRQLDHRRGAARRRRDQHELRRAGRLAGDRGRGQVRVEARRRDGRGGEQREHDPPGASGSRASAEGDRSKLHRGKGLVVTAAEYGGSRAWFRPGKEGRIACRLRCGIGEPGEPGLFSNFPSNLTLLDTGIPPRVPPCHCRTSFEGDIRFAYIEGTSMAAPQVAGAAALIRARRPGIDAKRVIEILKQKAAGTGSGAASGGVLDAGYPRCAENRARFAARLRPRGEARRSRSRSFRRSRRRRPSRRSRRAGRSRCRRCSS